MRRSLAFVLVAGAVNEARCVARESPLDKVVTLLSDLQTKLLSEGEQEAATYEKFACFCKDTTAEKSSAISTGQATKTQLEASLAAATVARDDKDTIIADANSVMAQTRDEIKDLSAERRKSLLDYEKNEVDMTAALQGLDAAIQSLKAASTATSASLLQSLGPLAGSVRQALSIADALGFIDTASKEGARVASAMAMLQAQGASAQRAGARARRGGSLRADPTEAPEVFDVPTTVYSFSSGDIVTTLEDLKTKFRAKKDELDTQEVQARTEYDTLVQTKETLIADKQKEMDTAAREKGAEAEKIAGLSTDLTTTSAQLLDDQQVLAELSKKCGGKATVWDQRSKSRADELTALSTALSILKDLAQQSAATTPAPKTALLSPHAEVTSHAEASRSVSRRPRVSLAARRATAAAAPPAGEEEQRERVVSLLRDGAARVQSALLRAVAEEAKEDPFAKVKVMIQELIERLLKEAASEASHKGWCDQEVASAEQQRTYAAEAIKELNGQLATLEGRQDKLTLFLQDVNRELLEINDTLSNSSSLRDQEKARNNQTITDAKEGKKAVEQAYTMLQKYYAKAASDTALAQTGADPAPAAPAAPDAGFDGAYQGAQGAQTGVMGMLELIMADFDEAVAATEKAEKQAAQDFIELETTLGASRAEKQVAQEQRQKALVEADTEHDAAWTKFDAEQKKLDGALTQYLALKPACFDSGMSAEERRLQREEEMDALKQALCILDQHGASGVQC